MSAYAWACLHTDRVMYANGHCETCYKRLRRGKGLSQRHPASPKRVAVGAAQPEPRAATVALPYPWDEEMQDVLADLPEDQRLAAIETAKTLTLQRVVGVPA